MEMHNPDALLRMLWFQNTVHFGMHTVTEHVNMKWGDVKLCTCGFVAKSCVGSNIK
jgi:hypothetical protein